LHADGPTLQFVERVRAQDFSLKFLE